MAEGDEKTAYEKTVEFAEGLTFASDAKKADWINEHMKAQGWVATTTWTAPTGDTGKGKASGGGWFK
jgi:hypothetical protein